MDTEKSIKKFNKIASEWLIDLTKMDEEKISINPTEDSWSLAEVYDHVMKVARSYQIPNLKRSVTKSAERKKSKNKIGIAIFNLGIRKQVKMRMQSFPAPLVKAFTPEKRTKADLIQDFELFIKEVNELKGILIASSKKNKHYHLMFGDINTKEWFSLIELHIWQHNKQKDKIKAFLEA